MYEIPERCRPCVPDEDCEGCLEPIKINMRQSKLGDEVDEYFANKPVKTRVISTCNDTCDEIKQALTDLVYLEEYKDEHGKDRDYEIMKIGAWQRAFSALGRKNLIQRRADMWPTTGEEYDKINEWRKSPDMNNSPGMPGYTPDEIALQLYPVNWYVSEDGKFRIDNNAGKRAVAKEVAAHFISREGCIHNHGLGLCEKCLTKVDKF